MDIFDEIGPLRAFLKQIRSQGKSIGLVPTMGALHRGHVSLIKASKAENQVTVCSIYVNPTQFNNPNDLVHYPRTMEKDKLILEEAGCDVLFCPSNIEMYSIPTQIKFDFGHLDKVLEGKFRPGHFSGVALAVAKLFNIVQPDIAYFGQKDFQQFKIIAQLVEELKFDLQLRCIPIHRENDGLAMSSRNQRLSKEERQKAVIFFETLSYAKEAVRAKASIAEIKSEVEKRFDKKDGVKLEYFEFADAQNLTVVNDVAVKGGIMIIAGFVGEVRLIDNMIVE